MDRFQSETIAIGQTYQQDIQGEKGQIKGLVGKQPAYHVKVYIRADIVKKLILK